MSQVLGMIFMTIMIKPPDLVPALTIAAKPCMMVIKPAAKMVTPLHLLWGNCADMMGGQAISKWDP